MIRVGSLFTGYGGLDLAVHEVLGGATAWVSDIDPGARRVLAHRYPDVPNLGDITVVDWAAVEPVDVLTGGSPCQDLSAAGKRLGMRPDTRSGLWSHMAYAISVLRPAVAVWENVRGATSAAADCDVEPCAWCVGGAGDGEPPLRALGCVLGDLADLGYDAAWVGVRASDIGAPHSRYRIFLTAWLEPGDPHGIERDGWEAAGLARETGPAVGSAADSDGVGHERVGEPRRRRSRSPDRRRPPADPGCDARPEDDPDQRPAPWGRGDASAETQSDGRREGRPEPARVARGPDADERGDTAAGDLRARAATDWGPFRAAITRWEHALGRHAPAPTEPGENGQPMLSPRFVEWMQGLPDGWVTDPTIWRGVRPASARRQQLKALGNGVVPQQAVHALRSLFLTVPTQRQEAS